MRFYTWYEILLGTAGAVVFIAGAAAVAWLLMKSGNKAAEKFRSENPDSATIWIVSRRNSGVSIKKTDGKKSACFQGGLADGSSRTYVLPGAHVLTVKYTHTDESVTKQPEYKKLRNSSMNVILEPRKDYTLLFNHRPGEYALAEGKPEDLESTYL